MVKRLTTGIAYLAVLIAFYLARLFCRDRFFGALLFDLLILLFAVLGTFEICRALERKIDRLQKILVSVFSAVILLAYALTDSLCRVFSVQNVSFGAAVAAFAAAIAVLLGLSVIRHEETSLESVGCSLLALVYPTIFLLLLSMINHMEGGELGLLFVFALCPFTDCFAFVFGMLLKKRFPRKMAPHVSPNKTVVGCLGGIIGGAIGAVCIFFLYYGLICPADFGSKWIALLYFLVLGVLVALFAEFGDLVESAIKRKLGIKDMGKLLPGHGGILDRIDSALYASLIVAFALWIAFMTAGGAA